jgi:hypothetical protein
MAFMGTIEMDRKFAKQAIRSSVALLIVPLLAACGAGATPIPQTPVTDPKVSFDFRNGAQGWNAGFADYPPGQEQSFQLESGVRDLPPGIEPGGTGFYIAGNNHSDDLFMFLKRKIGKAEGVLPDTTYTLTFKILFASNAPSGCTGIGGAPGESVTLKAGASNIEPKPEEQSGTYRLNVDKGEQTSGGPAGEVTGNIANGTPCDQAAATGNPYVSLTKEHTGELSVKSSASGDLWLLVGTDSGYEGVTALYFQRIDVRLVSVP